MAKQIVWRKLKNKLQDLNWVTKHNETELSLYLKNGSTISLKGADNYDSLRGVGLDFIVLDEFADIDQAAWYETLRPTLSDKQGRALFIGTPKGIGNWAYEIYQNCQNDPASWASFTYTTLDGGNVPPEEVEQARKDLDERTFRQEYMATFETFAGRIYYGFDRAANVKSWDKPIPNVIYIGMDFNIDPMSAVIAAREGDSLYVIDEIRLFSSNTQEAVAEIKSRYRSSKIWVYPDPAGYQRKSSAGGATDITILHNAGFVVKAPRNHTPVRDRINAVNSRLCSSSGIRQLYIDPKCKYTIEGLERQTYKEGSTQPDKDGGYDHMNDALGYMVDYLFPVKRDVDPDAVQPRRWTHALA
jgi:phage terminase large subunit